ncbi:S1 family peptidase [Desulfobotulus mexicanus]|uniref:Trypsin-like peptidase domain-containing protein n=1 Tax=Desulfobotulus mexicanus TaxID=2586642 RepID=A0A5Q4VD52_9BACT|nr:serine protease [Desulfobotulus mexicanus]TYT75634.1 trypsin-like peptidase domain-containing protein [Desulfobotulus mexicanus]
MSLQAHYAKIREGIFAFVPKYASPHQKEQLPPVLGTGFFIRKDGIAVTNAHIIETFAHVFRPEGLPDKDWAIQGLFFVRDNTEMLALRVDLKAVIRMGSFILKPPGSQTTPDIGLVQMAVSDCPVMHISEKSHLEEGMEIATAGFPMGNRSLESPAGLQMGPTLQKGIISAILPFPNPSPEAFSVNVMSLGGASGSPVFDPGTGSTLGVLFSSLHDVGLVDQGTATYAMPTSITYAVPHHYLIKAIAMVPDNLPKMPSLKQRIREHKSL